MPYKVIYIAAWAVLVLSLGLGAIQVADPTTLGFSPIATRWISVVGSFLGSIGAFLPRVQKPPGSDGGA